MCKNLNFFSLAVVTLLTLLIQPASSWTQTVLRPGDLAIVGVNANLGGCGATGGEDEISFIAFKDILPGTEIHFTDNGWQRLNPDQWGNNEGFLIARRSPSAAVIPAGTLIVVRFPSIPSMDNPVRAVLPDADWIFDNIGLNNFNLRDDGDQMYILQGGIWNDGDASIGNSQHNASYIGGNVLFGFNTKSIWVDFGDSPGESGLHPDVTPCFHMEPTGGSTRYISYQGPAGAASQLEWISRIANPLNWLPFADCESYRRPMAQFAITPTNVGLACTTCSGCGFVEEQLVLTLPDNGGPFTVEYSNGIDTLPIENVVNGDIINAQLTQTTTFSIISVADANGCPIYSNLGGPVEVEVFKQPIAAPAGPLRVCNAGGSGAFNLTSLNETIRNGESGIAVRWYRDVNLSSPISNPQNFVSTPTTVFATTFNGNCESEPVAISLEIGTTSDPVIVVTNPISCNGDADGAIALQTSGQGTPYQFNWSDDDLDGQEFGVGLSAGVYEVTVTDVDGCEEIAGITLTQPASLDLSCGQVRAVSTVNGSDGVAGINITGGTAPYSLEWSGPAIGTQTAANSGNTQITGLVAGTYTVILTDANGCNLDCIFTINDPSCNFTVSFNKTNASCPDVPNGTIDLIFNGGQAPYTIDWNVDAFDGLQNLTDLPVGNYSALVTDNQGCSNNVTVTINALNTSPSVLIPEVGTTCQNEPYEIVLNFTGRAPFELPIRLDAGKGEVSTTFTTNQNRDTFVVIPEEFGLVNGNIVINFDALFDQTTCPISINEQRILQVLPNDQGFLDTVLCQEDFLFFNGTIYDRNNTSGLEVLDEQTVNGCDSTVNVNISFFPVAQTTIDTLLCADETILVNGTLYGANRRSGTEVIPNATANGCDSLVFVDIEVDEANMTVISSTLCEGESLRINGITYDINNPRGTEIFPKPQGCDSTVFVNLNFIPTIRDTFNVNLCPGASIDFNGVTYSESNPGGIERYIAASGCDSLVVIDVDFNFIRESFFDTTICEGDQLVINGTVYDRNNRFGREVFPVLNDQCDSFVNITLNIRRAIKVRLGGGGSVCPGDSINLVFRVTDTDAVDLELSDGQGGVINLTNVTDGYTYRVAPAVTTTYAILSVSAEDIGTGCPPAIENNNVQVEVRPIEATGVPVSNFGDFNLSCPNSNDGVVTVDIDGGVPQYRVSWSTGAAGDTLSGLAAGDYQFTVTDANGCIDEGQVSLVAPDPITLEAEVVPPVCAGEETGAIILQGISGGTAPYEYSTDGQNFRALNQASPIITDLGSGTYSFTLQDVNDCTTISVVTIPSPQELRVDLGPDLTIRFGDSLMLEPVLNFLPAQFSWRPANSVSNPAILNPMVRPTETTTVVFSASDTAGCEVTDRLTITIDNSRDVYTPSAFSPNNDGINDFFSPLIGDNVRQIGLLQVYDRWGAMVYEGRNLPGDNSSGWNGRFKGDFAPAGVYVYYAEVEFLDGFREVIQGDVVLIR